MYKETFKLDFNSEGNDGKRYYDFAGRLTIKGDGVVIPEGTEFYINIPALSKLISGRKWPESGDTPRGRQAAAVKRGYSTPSDAGDTPF